MIVYIIKTTSSPEKVVALAAKTCYSSQTLFEKGIPSFLDMDEGELSKYIQHLFDIGHHSPFEHVSFTFGIEEVSRSLLAQLTRHRIASYSVRSQRYVSEKGFDYVTPPSILKNEKAEEIYDRFMEFCQNNYSRLLELGIPKEDARFILPNACHTSLVATFNARSLFNFFNLRCCNRAQWEIRNLAIEMLKIVRRIAPNIFRKAGPPCLVGNCPEGEKGCGKAKEVWAFFEEI